MNKTDLKSDIIVYCILKSQDEKFSTRLISLCSQYSRYCLCVLSSMHSQLTKVSSFIWRKFFSLILGGIWGTLISLACLPVWNHRNTILPLQDF